MFTISFLFCLSLLLLFVIFFHLFVFFFFFFNDTATTEIYTLSLHDAFPIWSGAVARRRRHQRSRRRLQPVRRDQDRKSTRLNSSHANISYAVFCLKKKKKKNIINYKTTKQYTNIKNNERLKYL